MESKNHVIDKPIVSYALKKPEDEQVDAPKKDTGRIEMNEDLPRPERLTGTTYKIKPPVGDHAMYITINDIVLNAGTEFEEIRPYEIFINSKDPQHQQWVHALTRILSAVFRKGGDIIFVVDELLNVYDPEGGYFKKGGTKCNSIVADIGFTIKDHLKSIGIIQPEEVSEHAQAILDEKRQKAMDALGGDSQSEGQYPPNATSCPKCHEKAVIVDNGCASCLACGDSKCS